MTSNQKKQEESSQLVGYLLYTRQNY